MTTAWVLGDQLHRAGGSFADDPDRVLMIESESFATRRTYHRQKLALVFAAMRHHRDDLRADGVNVAYVQAASFADGLDAFLADNPDADLVVQDPLAHGATDRLRDLVASRAADASLSVVDHANFLVDPAAFDDWHDGDTYRHEAFYRWVRRETGYLMDGEDPVGGEWNYDDQNRETPPPDYATPDPPSFEFGDVLDGAVAKVRSLDDRDDTDLWGDLDGFDWPVTRDQAETALADFCEHRLADFGPYQDAMVDGDATLNHSLLSPALNLGLLSPDEVTEAAIETYRARDDVPINSVEGFVRQVVGWREFVRHVYRCEMPGLAAANQLDQDRTLPPAYRDPSRTDMRCLAEAVRSVRETGYAHHIQRLMVLSNLALTHGVDPAALADWFHGAFVDAFHWVATPNVVGMGSFATDAFTTKPYAASANYVDRMSDYCTDCRYDPVATVGDDACPLNSLYWEFLAEHEDRLRDEYRMGLVYGHLDDKRDAGDLEAIRERADEVRARLADGDP